MEVARLGELAKVLALDDALQDADLDNAIFLELSTTQMLHAYVHKRFQMTNGIDTVVLSRIHIVI